MIAAIFGGTVLVVGGVLTLMEQNIAEASSDSREIHCASTEMTVTAMSSSGRWVNLSIQNTGQNDFSTVSVTAMEEEAVLGSGVVRHLRPGAYTNVRIRTDSVAGRVLLKPASCPSAALAVDTD